MTDPSSSPRSLEERRKAGTPLVVALAALVLGGFAAAVWMLVPHGDSQMTADIPAIEQTIHDGVKDQGGITGVVTVDCPDSIDWKVGGEFHCVVEADDGSRAMATVSMENDKGDVTWAVE